MATNEHAAPGDDDAQAQALAPGTTRLTRGAQPRSSRAAPRSATRTRRAAAAHPLTAFVLHRYDWSESSLIVELFTRAQGRVVAVAKGAKRPTSNFRPLLLPFLPLQVVLGKPPKDEGSEVVNLRSAEWCGGVPLLPSGALMSAYYLNELLLKLLARQDAHAELFDAYADTLVALALAHAPAAEDHPTGLPPVDASDAPAAHAGHEATVLRAFELVLLRELGVLPDLAEVTLTAQPLQADRRYSLHADHGLVADDDAGAPGAVWLALDPVLAAGTMSGLRHCCAPAAAALRGPLRALLHYHLGQRPLRTRQVWQGVQRLAESPVR
jgi:DNA repair protein RecO (recombination protein O)